MSGTAVRRWFGPQFEKLHPLLQALHERDSMLRGTVDVRFGSGLAGALGRRLARRAGVPAHGGTHAFAVAIRHTGDALLWTRRFDAVHVVRSTFEPVGHWPDGWWVERSGNVAVRLTVDVIDGGWHWRVLGAHVRGVPLPRVLLPRATAYKRIEEARYRFEVAFGYPLLGEAFGYGGLLEADAGAPA